MIIQDNVEAVRREIAECGRLVTVIAATKTQPAEVVDELMRVAPEFEPGENRVQEFQAKFNPAYRWHFIGQLQTNKVKYVVGKAALIHSLDRTELAAEIEKQAARRGIVQPCLVEINAGAEISKGGVAPEDTPDFIAEMEKYPHLRIEGIMSVLPNLGDCPELDEMYEKLAGIYGAAAALEAPHADIKYFSAGMSNDYRCALRHGANMIRLGRALFGERVSR